MDPAFSHAGVRPGQSFGHASERAGNIDLAAIRARFVPAAFSTLKRPCVRMRQGLRAWLQAGQETERAGNIRPPAIRAPFVPAAFPALM